jgi:D-xylose transport system ATP-binding protein
VAEYLLEMRSIAKSFGAVKALSDVNLRIRTGELHAICGENGAGKSTLMKILDGYYPHGSYQGDILLNGRKLCLHTPADAARAGIAMIYQEISTHPNLSVAENVFLGNLPVKAGIVSSKDLGRAAEDALAKVGLNVDVRQPASRLSTSQQQLVMIAKALVQNPRLLVLDEPTSALALTETDYLHSVLEALKEQGVTCIYISHKLDEVFQIADSITVLRDGQTVRSFDRDEFDTNQVIEAMVGREIKDCYPKETIEPGEEVLRVENLSVAHPKIRGHKLVNGVGFSVRRGEILGIAGLVGSGRSETLGAIYGSKRRISGDIYVDGQKITITSPRQALAQGIALVTEDRHKTGLALGMTISQNITLASLKNISWGCLIRSGVEKSAASTIAADLQVKAPSLSTPVKNLSGGNQQKVVLAKWLLRKPLVLLLDEPTRGIDVGAKCEIYKLIGTLARQGTAIVMVSSELPELMEICDRFVVLADGRVVDEFSRSEASENRVMIAATGVSAG